MAVHISNYRAAGALSFPDITHARSTSADTREDRIRRNPETAYWVSENDVMSYMIFASVFGPEYKKKLLYDFFYIQDLDAPSRELSEKYRVYMDCSTLATSKMRWQMVEDTKISEKSENLPTKNDEKSQSQKNSSQIFFESKKKRVKKKSSQNFFRVKKISTQKCFRLKNCLIFCLIGRKKTKKVGNNLNIKID